MRPRAGCSAGSPRWRRRPRSGCGSSSTRSRCARRFAPSATTSGWTRTRRSARAPHRDGRRGSSGRVRRRAGGRRDRRPIVGEVTDPSEGVVLVDERRGAAARTPWPRPLLGSVRTMGPRRPGSGTRRLRDLGGVRVRRRRAAEVNSSASIANRTWSRHRADLQVPRRIPLASETETLDERDRTALSGWTLASTRCSPSVPKACRSTEARDPHHVPAALKRDEGRVPQVRSLAGCRTRRDRGAAQPASAPSSFRR